MDVYEHFISEEGVKALARVIGRRISQLLTTTVEVHDRFVTAPYFSVSIDEGQYLVVESDWEDTPREYIDYYLMNIAVESAPKDITFGEVEGIECLERPVSVIHIEPAGEVVGVEILEMGDRGTTEGVRCDFALVFMLGDGRRFAIAQEESILGQLSFTTDSAEVDRYRRSCTVRKGLGLKAT